MPSRGRHFASRNDDVRAPTMTSSSPFHLGLFRFENQTEGDAYLRSHPPVYYLKGVHGDSTALPSPGYKDRAHSNNINEGPVLVTVVMPLRP